MSTFKKWLIGIAAAFVMLPALAQVMPSAMYPMLIPQASAPPTSGLQIVVGKSGLEGPPIAVINTSPDGITWTNQTNGFGSGGVIRSATFGVGLYVVGGQNGSGNGEIETSPDGITWTSRSNGFNGGGVFALTFGNGIYLAGGFNSTDGLLQTSTDAVSWISRVTGFTGFGSINAVIYGGGIYIAGGQYSTFAGGIETSPDGITWTGRTNGFFTVNGFAYNGTSIYVAIGSLGNDTEIETSPDGVTWTPRVNTFGGTASDGWSVAWGNATFCAVGQAADASGHVSSSPDGITWTARVNNFTGAAIIQSIAWSPSTNLFIITGINNASEPQIDTSPDCIAWTTRTNAFPAGQGIGFGAFGR